MSRGDGEIVCPETRPISSAGEIIFGAMLAVKILFRLLELRSKVAKLMDLLVSYYWNHFSRARREVVHVLRKFGDSMPQVERTGVIGIAIVHTSLNNRGVIRRCKELFRTGFVFRFAIKWVPVDFWCETSLDAIKKVIDDNISGAIGENETWGMKVEKRRWRKYHTIQIIEHLAAGVNRKVNLSSPDKLIRVDVLGERTAISLLKPGEIFSITAGAAMIC